MDRKVRVKTRGTANKGGCLVGAKGRKPKGGCKVGRKGVGNESAPAKKRKPAAKPAAKKEIKLKIPASRLKKPDIKLKIPASRLKKPDIKLKIPKSRLATAKSEDSPAKQKEFADKYKKNRGNPKLAPKKRKVRFNIPKK